MTVEYMPAGYWARRKGLAYYEAIAAELERLSPGDSLLDVGGWDTPVVLWGTYDRRFTCDLGRDPCFPGVTSHVGDFLEWTAPEPMQVTVCAQVLEHFPLETAQRFAQKLLAGTKYLIVSVPWKWPKGGEPSHQLDPIDDVKLRQIMGRLPERRTLVSGSGRSWLVATYWGDA